MYDNVCLVCLQGARRGLLCPAASRRGERPPSCSVEGTFPLSNPAQVRFCQHWEWESGVTVLWIIEGGRCRVLATGQRGRGKKGVPEEEGRTLRWPGVTPLPWLQTFREVYCPVGCSVDVAAFSFLLSLFSFPPSFPFSLLPSFLFDFFNRLWKWCSGEIINIIGGPWSAEKAGRTKATGDLWEPGRSLDSQRP